MSNEFRLHINLKTQHKVKIGPSLTLLSGVRVQAKVIPENHEGLLCDRICIAADIYRQPSTLVIKSTANGTKYARQIFKDAMILTLKKNRNFFLSSWRIIVLNCKILMLAI
jgi:hypothetical protein